MANLPFLSGHLLLWSPQNLPLWPLPARRRARAFMLMLGRGRKLQSCPDDDPGDRYAHALPTEVLWNVLGSVDGNWMWPRPVPCLATHEYRPRPRSSGRRLGKMPQHPQFKRRKTGLFVGTIPYKRRKVEQ